MSKIDTGGPAYPAPAFAEAQGMTLLDYLAGQVMQALVGDPSIREHFTMYDEKASRQMVARACYGTARELIAEKRRLEGL